MAKKLQASQGSRVAAQLAEINLRMATIPFAGGRVPPRVRKVPTVRRRLPVTMIQDDPRPVIIRQGFQNVGSAVSGTQPIQTRHA